jgi:hypothetical protein
MKTPALGTVPGALAALGFAIQVVPHGGGHANPRGGVRPGKPSCCAA